MKRLEKQFVRKIQWEAMKAAEQSEQGAASSSAAVSSSTKPQPAKDEDSSAADKSMESHWGRIFAKVLDEILYIKFVSSKWPCDLSSANWSGTTEWNELLEQFWKVHVQSWMRKKAFRQRAWQLLEEHLGTNNVPVDISEEVVLQQELRLQQLLLERPADSSPSPAPKPAESQGQAEEEPQGRPVDKPAHECAAEGGAAMELLMQSDWLTTAPSDHETDLWSAFNMVQEWVSEAEQAKVHQLLMGKNVHKSSSYRVIGVYIWWPPPPCTYLFLLSFRYLV